MTRHTLIATRIAALCLSLGAGAASAAASPALDLATFAKRAALTQSTSGGSAGGSASSSSTSSAAPSSSTATTPGASATMSTQQTLPGSSTPIKDYYLFRKIAAGALALRPDAAIPALEIAKSGIPPGITLAGWDYLATIPATGRRRGRPEKP